ncbi:MAG: hypothetical protein ACI9VT_001348 [Psychroserpens sp.]|jgi:hypothetical protein
MRKQTLNTLEVFRYACVNQVQCVNWDRETIQRIENQLLSAPKLSRLHALIYQHAIERDHLDWFSSNFQIKLKLSTYSIIADIGAKKNEINHLAQLLEGHDLTVLLLKGLAFNGYIYRDNAPRGSSDIDILINPQDKNKFCDVLQQMATFVAPNTVDAFGGMFEETWRVNNTSAVYFDLHWYLSYPSLFTFNTAEMASRSIKHPIYESEIIRLLSNEDHIVYLASHLLKDCDFFHYGLIDCHELICQQDPELTKCFLIAEQWGIKTGLYYLLKQSKELQHTPIPQSILMHNKPNFFRNKMCNFALNKLFTKPSLLKTSFHRVKQLFAVFLFSDSVTRVVKHNLIYIKRAVQP